jgi:hypothetical protein
LVVISAVPADALYIFSQACVVTSTRVPGPATTLQSIRSPPVSPPAVLMITASIEESNVSGKRIFAAPSW